jgi:hypothetical protein
MRLSLLWGVLLSGVILTAGCALLEDTGVVEAPTSVPMRNLRSDMRPLAEEQCRALATLLTQTGLVFTATQAPFQDQIAGGTGAGCHTPASATGENVPDMAALAGQVRDLLAADGWGEDGEYAATSAVGMAAAFRKEAALCLFSLGWQPSPDARCPSDRPVGECRLTPQQKLYSVFLLCAE